MSGLAPLGGFAPAVLLRIRDGQPFGQPWMSSKWLAISVGSGVGVILLNFAVAALLVTTFTDVKNLQQNYQAAAMG